MNTAFVVLAIEWIQPPRRATWWALAQLPLSLSVLTLALTAYLLQNWHAIQIVLTLSNALALSFYWLVLNLIRHSEILLR